MIDVKKIHPLFLVLIASILVTGGAYYFSFFDILEEKITDRFFLKQAPTQDIVIISIDNESINEIGQWPWSREVFAEAISNLSSAKAIGIDVNFFEPTASDVVFASALAETAVPVVISAQIEEKSGLLIRPIKSLRKYAAFGVTTVPLERDLFVRFASSRFDKAPSFAAALIDEDIFFPSTMRIDFVGPEGTFPTIPLVDLLEKRIPERLLKDKLILIGATATDLHDVVQTPFGNMPGVELHANIINSVLVQSFFRETPFAIGLIALIILNSLAALFIAYVRQFRTLIVSLVALFASIELGAMLLFQFHIIIPHFYFLLGVTITGSTGISLQYIRESKEKRFIRNSFQRYLSTDVVEEIIKDPSKLKLGGVEKKVTILFSDIRGFTAVSELLSPEALMAWLNAYLTEMTEIILQNKGFIDKYIGDAVMAFWGAPLKNDAQAVDCCTSAVLMIQHLKALNKRWKKDNIHPISIGIGINTGEVIVGNMGSEKRFDYTIIGDEVNFSSRIEGLNKFYGTTIIISESTKKEIENNSALVVRDLDLVTVKGKKEPKRIYELITEDVTPEIKRTIVLFEEGRRYYADGMWDKAIRCFRKALTVRKDKPSELFLERTLALKKNPPSKWTGVYEFTVK